MQTSLVGVNSWRWNSTWRDRANARAWWLRFVGLIAVLAALGAMMFLRGAQATILAWLIYLIGAAAILYRPRNGLYIILFMSLVGDALLMPWYPVTKNFSSPESAFFVHDALIVNPLETYLLLTFISWLGRDAMQRKLSVFRGELFWPASVFLGFVIAGLAYGVGTGGNLNIALWEARPIFYMVAMLVLTSNLLKKREHVNNLIWAAMLALMIEGIVGSSYLLIGLKGRLDGVEAITEHSAAIHMNTFFVLALAAWLYNSSIAKRLVLPVFTPVVLLTYLATQRRAAFLSLGIALVFMAVMLYREKRQLFWIIVPPMMIALLGYIVVFWNATGALGLPAQAVKSIVAPEQASAADISSNVYRDIENVNTSFTVHQKPLTGVGFGQKFYILVPLPDISFFEWWEYLPHNSLIWVWLKTGIGGFISMLVLVGMAVSTGAGVTRRMPRGDLRAIALTATLYLVMHFTYAYVDISWDSQSMVYIGTMIGIINRLEHVVAKDLPHE